MQMNRIVLPLYLVLCIFAVSLCPAAGQDFQNTPCPAVKIIFFKISVNNVKSLVIWLNTNFGEPGTRYIEIYNVDYYKMTGSKNV